MNFDKDFGLSFGYDSEVSAISPSSTISSPSTSTPSLIASPSTTSSLAPSPSLSSDLRISTDDLLSPHIFAPESMGMEDASPMAWTPPTFLLVEPENLPQKSKLHINVSNESEHSPKKARLFAEADSAVPSHNASTVVPGSSPTIISIPSAQASDLPRRDRVKKRIRKRAATGARSMKHKVSPRSSVRFCFVSVQHEAQDAADSVLELTERIEEDAEPESFEHGPSELPPRPYPDGEYAVSPLKPSPHAGKIPASLLDFLPALESRFTRLECAIERYVDWRSKQALRYSLLPDASLRF